MSDREIEGGRWECTVWCFSIGSSKFTTPGRAAVTRSYYE